MTVRGCAECGQHDTHPRHVVGLLNAPAGTPAPTPRHIDCCAATGCGPCTRTVASADGRTGQALIDWLAVHRAARTLED